MDKRVKYQSMKEVEKALAKLGFVKVRSKKHPVWKDDRGRSVVLPFSASDWRAVANLTSELRRRGIEI